MLCVLVVEGEGFDMKGQGILSSAQLPLTCDRPLRPADSGVDVARAKGGQAAARWGRRLCVGFFSGGGGSGVGTLSPLASASSESRY